MTDKLQIMLAQVNPTVGAVGANAQLARHAYAKATAAGADLLVFPELFMSGYPPEDLVLKPAFVRACRTEVEALCELTTADGAPAMLMTTPWAEDGKLYNAALLLEGGAISAVRYKHDLPNYGVFDEKRVFDAGPAPGPVNFRGVRLGVPICEDIWTGDVCETLEETGAEILIVPNGSPFERDKQDVRLNLVVARITETGLPMIYLNQVGGQDELVFDGASFVLNGDRTLACQLPEFEDALVMTRWHRKGEGWICEQGETARQLAGYEEIWHACVLGTRDYVRKNRFDGVVLGLSGGIDSAVVAAIAVDALGPDKVHCVMLPYEYTAKISLEDAQACAEALGVRYDVVPIKAPVEGFLDCLAPMFEGTPEGVTEENIQSRTRGAILMAISNKFGSMVLTTGNKSEMSVGYATLYGDMNGGFNPIKDVYKSDVYALASWRNQSDATGLKGSAGRVIPERIITRAPSAELRPDQTDQDSLPPYEMLDSILNGLVEGETSLRELVAQGYDKTTVERIQHLLFIAEYKRRQAAPGVKITRRAFGKERRYPITNGFRDKA
jgi:NAD+ synthase